MRPPITTPIQFEALKSETLMWAAIICVAAFAISYLVATLIPYKGGRDNSHVIRRICFVVITLLTSAGYWVYNLLAQVPRIKNAAWQGDYSQINLITENYLKVGMVFLDFLVDFFYLYCITHGFMVSNSHNLMSKLDSIFD